ncbi:MAG: hypothetical protein BSR46_05325 [Candidatus Dactylopiibacterium carminicum]|nr:MAG: hypothetical protein BSR46_05325 [Candidatus Dactylopiibacterium carminicum]
MNDPVLLQRISRLSRAGFWLATLAFLILALLPGERLPPGLFDWWDKAQHALAFLVLGTLGFTAYPARHWRISLGLGLFGAFVEFAQAATGWRSGDVQDWLADATGILLALALRAIWRANFASRRPVSD